MKLDPQQYRIELLKKLLEEAKEAVDAKNAEDLLMELGDVQEVIDALLKSIGKTRNELDVLQSKRREDRGAFDQCLFLEWSEG
jgi:predicted house-cleaning noncanonical NTP pyrophosphatase (MazG superfamily)